MYERSVFIRTRGKRLRRPLDFMKECFGFLCAEKLPCASSGSIFLPVLDSLGFWRKHIRELPLSLSLFFVYIISMNHGHTPNSPCVTLLP